MYMAGREKGSMNAKELPHKATTLLSTGLSSPQTVE
jgi:hypothetical protein